jgi:plastocyanin
MSVRPLITLAAIAAGVWGLSHGGATAQSATGTIRGRILLAGPPPPNPPIRMGADPACSALNGGSRPAQEFVVVDAAGGLANVFVHLQGTFPSTPVPATAVRLEQKGCVYRPHVIGLRVGQTLQVANDDPTIHNMHGLSGRGNEFNASRPAGTPPFEVTLKAEEMMLRVTCDIHSWMNIFVGVVNHPYFAVSGTDGTFEIRGVPAGPHPIQAWHERYGPLNATVEVTAGATATVDFTYTGSEKAAPPTVRTIAVPDGSLLARFDR